MTSKLIVGEALNEIKSRINIVQFIQDEYGVIMREQGKPGHYVTNCIMPNHRDSDPSFTANEDKGLFRCFGCGVAGDVVSLVMRVEGLTFMDAVKRLALHAGVPLNDDDEAMLGMTVRAIVRSLDSYLDAEDVAETLPAGMSTNEFCYAFAERMKSYEKEVASDVEWVDGVYRQLDDLLASEDFVGCTNLWRELARRMKDRKEVLCHEEG